MENLNPSLLLLNCLKFGLERGLSVRAAAKMFLKEGPNDLTEIVAQWLGLRDQGKSPESLLKGVRSPYRQALLRTMDRGICGESVHATLTLIEKDLVESIRSELDEFLAILPLKMLIPLLLFQFPAFLLLLFGPLLKDLLTSF